MKIYFRKVTCTLLALCLTLTGCASNQQAEQAREITEITVRKIPSEDVSEVVTVEAIPVPILANIAIGDNWCYMRFSLTREKLEELADDANVTTLSLTGVMPGDDAFYINVTNNDVVQSLQLLDENPEQQAISLVKPLPLSAVADFVDEPEGGIEYINYWLTMNDFDYIYYFVTVDDLQRMLTALQSVNGDTYVIRQRCDINSVVVARSWIEYAELKECLENLRSTDQTYTTLIYRFRRNA